MKKKNHKNKKTPSTFRNVMILAGIALAVSIMTCVVYVTYKASMTYHIETLNASFKVQSTIGLAGDSDVLNFGSGPIGSTSTREITLSHQYTRPLKVEIVYDGNIAQILDPIEPFVLAPNVEKKIGITARAHGPNNTNYTGTVKIEFIKP